MARLNSRHLICSANARYWQLIIAVAELIKNDQTDVVAEPSDRRVAHGHIESLRMRTAEAEIPRARYDVRLRLQVRPAHNVLVVAGRIPLIVVGLKIADVGDVDTFLADQE